MTNIISQNQASNGRKYGIKITDKQTSDSINVSKECLDDFSMTYMNQMINGEKIHETTQNNTIYPLTHVPHQWIEDWINTTDIKHVKTRKHEENVEHEILDFLEKHNPNVQESIKQSVSYLEENNQ